MTYMKEKLFVSTTKIRVENQIKSCFGMMRKLLDEKVFYEKRRK